jgi:phosphonate transport system ATP-binding protein
VASLDPATAHRVLLLLHEISRREGISVVVSLHQVDMARKFADRIVGLAGGRVVFDGGPAELTEDVVNKIYNGESPRNIPKYDPFEASGENALSDLATIEP